MTKSQTKVHPLVAQEEMRSFIDLGDWLTRDEKLRIHIQFLSDTWKPNKQVLWTGMNCSQVQKWAKKYNLQTLTMAMWPLMDLESRECPRRYKTQDGWSRYVHGASAIFAWHCSRGLKVTVFTPPPPQKFNPHGPTYYQITEEPILKRVIAKGAPLRILMRHPAIKDAKTFEYEVYPIDKTATWYAVFGSTDSYLDYRYDWRQIGKKSQKASLRIKIQENPESATTWAYVPTCSSLLGVSMSQGVASKNSTPFPPPQQQKLHRLESAPNTQKASPLSRSTTNPASVTSASTQTSPILENTTTQSAPKNKNKKEKNKEQKYCEYDDLPIASRTRSKTKALREAMRSRLSAQNSRIAETNSTQTTRRVEQLMSARKPYDSAKVMNSNNISCRSAATSPAPLLCLLNRILVTYMKAYLYFLTSYYLLMILLNLG